MTDKHDDEFGFDAEDVEHLKRTLEEDDNDQHEEAAELEAELDIDFEDDADDLDDDAGEDEVKKEGKGKARKKKRKAKAFDQERLERISKAARESESVRKKQDDNDADEENEAPAKKKSSGGLIVGLAGVAITAAVAAGGYFYVLPMVLGGSAGYSAGFQGAPASDGFQGQASFAQETEPSQPETSGFEQGVNSEALADFGIESSGDSIPEDFGDFTDSFSDNLSDDALAGGTGELGGLSQDQYAFNESDAAAYVEDDEQDEYSGYSESDGDVVLRPAPLSDEERMYDNILAEANTLDVPHEAIKIDRNVINMELQIKRISRAELDIAETRQALGAMSNVIDEIREQTVEISKAIDASNKRSEAFRGELKTLSEKVDKQIESQKTDISSLRKEFKALASAPAVEAKPKAKAEPKPTPKPAKAAPKPKIAAAPAPAPKPKEATLPKPTRPVTVKAPTPPREVSQACDTTRVSENWRVKGVTPTSAYVVRTQDGQGLLLRAGIALPGFGTVKSFNPNERTVCTTSGIVRR